MVALGTALAALAPSAQPSQAGHRPNSYCNPSGDISQSTRKHGGKRVLAITLAAKYFNSYRLCVRAPDDTSSCKRFDIEENDGLFGDRVRWKRHFTDAGPGRYKVVWRNAGARIGKRLGFHR